MSDSVWSHRRQPTRLPRPWDSPGKNTGMGCHFLLQCMKVKSESEVAQSCLTVSNPMDYRLPVSSIHGIFQARVLEWVAIAFSEWKFLLTKNSQALGTVKCNGAKCRVLGVWQTERSVALSVSYHFTFGREEKTWMYSQGWIEFAEVQVAWILRVVFLVWIGTLLLKQIRWISARYLLWQ